MRVYEQAEQMLQQLMLSEQSIIQEDSELENLKAANLKQRFIYTFLLVIYLYRVDKDNKILRKYLNDPQTRQFKDYNKDRNNLNFLAYVLFSGNTDFPNHQRLGEFSKVVDSVSVFKMLSVLKRGIDIDDKKLEHFWDTQMKKLKPGKIQQEFFDEVTDGNAADMDGAFFLKFTNRMRALGMAEDLDVYRRGFKRKNGVLISTDPGSAAGAGTPGQEGGVDPDEPVSEPSKDDPEDTLHPTIVAPGKYALELDEVDGPDEPIASQYIPQMKTQSSYAFTKARRAGDYVSSIGDAFYLSLQDGRFQNDLDELIRFYNEKGNEGKNALEAKEMWKQILNNAGRAASGPIQELDKKRREEGTEGSDNRIDTPLEEALNSIEKVYVTGLTRFDLDEQDIIDIKDYLINTTRESNSIGKVHYRGTISRLIDYANRWGAVVGRNKVTATPENLRSGKMEKSPDKVWRELSKSRKTAGALLVNLVGSDRIAAERVIRYSGAKIKKVAMLILEASDIMKYTPGGSNNGIYLATDIQTAVTMSPLIVQDAKGMEYLEKCWEILKAEPAIYMGARGDLRYLEQILGKETGDLKSQLLKDITNPETEDHLKNTWTVMHKVGYVSPTEYYALLKATTSKDAGSQGNVTRLDYFGVLMDNAEYRDRFLKDLIGQGPSFFKLFLEEVRSSQQSWRKNNLTVIYKLASLADDELKLNVLRFTFPTVREEAEYDLVPILVRTMSKLESDALVALLKDSEASGLEPQFITEKIAAYFPEMSILKVIDDISSKVEDAQKAYFYRFTLDFLEGSSVMFEQGKPLDTLNENLLYSLIEFTVNLPDVYESKKFLKASTSYIDSLAMPKGAQVIKKLYRTGSSQEMLLKLTPILVMGYKGFEKEEDALEMIEHLGKLSKHPEIIKYIKDRQEVASYDRVSGIDAKLSKPFNHLVSLVKTSTGLKKILEVVTDDAGELHLPVEPYTLFKTLDSGKVVSDEALKGLLESSLKVKKSSREHGKDFQKADLQPADFKRIVEIVGVEDTVRAMNTMNANIFRNDKEKAVAGTASGATAHLLHKAIEAGYSAVEVAKALQAADLTGVIDAKGATFDEALYAEELKRMITFDLVEKSPEFLNASLAISANVKSILNTMDGKQLAGLSVTISEDDIYSYLTESKNSNLDAYEYETEKGIRPLKALLSNVSTSTIYGWLKDPAFNPDKNTEMRQGITALMARELITRDDMTSEQIEELAATRLDLGNQRKVLFSSLRKSGKTYEDLHKIAIKTMESDTVDTLGFKVGPSDRNLRKGILGALLQTILEQEDLAGVAEVAKNGGNLFGLVSRYANADTVRYFNKFKDPKYKSQLPLLKSILESLEGESTVTSSAVAIPIASHMGVEEFGKYIDEKGLRWGLTQSSQKLVNFEVVEAVLEAIESDKSGVVIAAEEIQKSYSIAEKMYQRASWNNYVVSPGHFGGDVAKMIYKVSQDGLLDMPHLDMEEFTDQETIDEHQLHMIETHDMKKHSVIAAKVLKVYKPKLPGQLEKFEEARKELGEPDSTIFYHGTDYLAANCILRSGFKIMKGSAQKAGKMMGDGIYFADVSNKSLQYVGLGFRGELGQLGVMFKCKLIFGKKRKSPPAHLKAENSEPHTVYAEHTESPEWAVKHPRQILITEVLLIETMHQSGYEKMKQEILARKGLKEGKRFVGKDTSVGLPSYFIFLDGTIPLPNGKVVPADSREARIFMSQIKADSAQGMGIGIPVYTKLEVPGMWRKVADTQEFMKAYGERFAEDLVKTLGRG